MGCTILFNDIRVFQLDLIRESGSKDIVSIIDSKISNLSKSSLEDYIMALARRVEAPEGLYYNGKISTHIGTSFTVQLPIRT